MGIDGGGTKTVFTLCDIRGEVLSSCRSGSADYRQVGLPGLKQLVEDGLKQVLLRGGLSDGKTGNGMPEGLSLWACMGVPNYGEDAVADREVERLLGEVFREGQLTLVNDCQPGWAGSLGMEPGINLVAGTGSISFGRNSEGQTATVGGWSDFFSDEGSCHWLGIRCLEIFSKEADGRLPKGALLRLMREKFELRSDKEIIGIVEREYRPSRLRTATLQVTLSEAAGQKDPAAIRAFEQAAEELMQIIRATAEALGLGEGTKVSFSGGLFYEGSPAFPLLRQKVEEAGMRYAPSRFSPDFGAVLLAAEQAGMLEGLLRKH